MRMFVLILVDVKESPKRNEQMQINPKLDVMQLIRLNSIEVRQSHEESQQKRKLSIFGRHLTKKPVMHRPMPYQRRQKDSKYIVRFQNQYQVYDYFCVTIDALILYIKYAMIIATMELRLQKIYTSRLFYISKSFRQIFILANPLLASCLFGVFYMVSYGYGIIQNNTILSMLIGAIIMKYSNPLQFLKIYTDKINPITDEMLLIPYANPQNPFTFYFEEMRPIYEFFATQMLPAAQPHRTEAATTTKARTYQLSEKYIMSADDSNRVQNSTPRMNILRQPRALMTIDEQIVERAKKVQTMMREIGPKYLCPLSQQNFVIIPSTEVQEVNISMKATLSSIITFNCQTQV